MPTTCITLRGMTMRGTNRAAEKMATRLRGFALADGRRQLAVDDPATLDPSEGSDPSGSIWRRMLALDAAIRAELAAGADVIVFGFSQGAVVAGCWLDEYADRPDAPHPARLRFVLAGNPSRARGGTPLARRKTRDDSQYRVLDVARRGDAFANWSGVSGFLSKLLGLFVTHKAYDDVDINDPANEVEVVGNTVYMVTS